MDSITEPHRLNTTLLRADDFKAFFVDRRETFLSPIEQAMGKQALTTDEPVPKDAYDPEEQAEPEMAPA